MQLFANNARSRLVGSLTTGATSFTIESPTADLFPVANTTDWLTPGDWFKAVLESDLGQVEIIYVGVRNGGSGVFSNVQRGREGTVPLALPAGAIVGVRLTAMDVQAMISASIAAVLLTGAQIIAGQKTFSAPIEALGGVVGDLTGNADTADLAALASALADGIVIPADAEGTTAAAKDASTLMATTAFVDRLRSLLPSESGSTLQISDRGAMKDISGTVTIPAGVFSRGDVVTLNSTVSSTVSLLAGSGMVMRLAGTSVAGNRSIAGYGVVTILFEGPSTCKVSGAGVT
jgi:hypothetical protein